MLPFSFETPISFFEKAGAPAEKQRRIGGIVSTEMPDRQGEIILQRGLEFSDFIKNGWFNDNHSKATADVLGYPELTKRFNKGDSLPDGQTAPANGTWAEGYLLRTDKADRIWELAQALQSTGRRLGFSVEGRIEKRQGPDNKTIAKALVRNIAVTNSPVNAQAKLEVLVKSLIAAERTGDEALERALSMGTPTPGVAPTGEFTGDGAGQVLVQEDLDAKRRKKSKIKKSLTTAEAIRLVRARVPNISTVAAKRVVLMTEALKRQGRL